jgi:hypothetical protein
VRLRASRAATGLRCDGGPSFCLARARPAPVSARALDRAGARRKRAHAGHTAHRASRAPRARQANRFRAQPSRAPDRRAGAAPPPIPLTVGIYRSRAPRRGQRRPRGAGQLHLVRPSPGSPTDGMQAVGRASRGAPCAGLALRGVLGALAALHAAILLLLAARRTHSGDAARHGRLPARREGLLDPGAPPAARPGGIYTASQPPTASHVPLAAPQQPPWTSQSTSCCCATAASSPTACTA